MDARRFVLAVALLYGALFVAFVSEGNVAQAGVAGVASLVAFSLSRWYRVRDASPDR